MKTKKLVVFGLGARGKIYANFAKTYPEKFALVAIVENDLKRLEFAKTEYPGPRLFNNYHRVSRYGHGTRFLKIKEIVKEAMDDTFGHGGGDYMMVKDFYDVLVGESELGTTLEASIESHLMALTAEKSRKDGQVYAVHKK